MSWTRFTKLTAIAVALFVCGVFDGYLMSVSLETGLTVLGIIVAAAMPVLMAAAQGGGKPTA